MSLWRQGDLLRPEDACRLGLAEDLGSNARVVVISHSCDLASSAEDFVELVVGRRVDEAEAVHQNGHSIRSLNLAGDRAEGQTDFALFQMQDRKFIQKGDIEAGQPWDEVRYPKSQRDLLRRWMAQRYSRSEFPDVFVSWLKDCRIEERLEKLAKKNSAFLVGIYFDLQDDSERDDPDAPYSLAITLVYKEDVAGAKESAERATAQIEADFEARCKVDGKWRWIELMGCECASDLEFPLGAANEFRRWRLEHRSVAGEPLPE